jgi:hypothetical protein
MEFMDISFPFLIVIMYIQYLHFNLMIPVSIIAVLPVLVSIIIINGIDCMFG